MSSGSTSEAPPARPPAGRLRNGSVRRPLNATRQPRWPAATAAARPIPLPAPVTQTTRSASLVIRRPPVGGLGRQLGGQFAPAHVHQGAGDVGRRVAGQEAEQIRHLLRPTPPSQRQGVQEPVLCGLVQRVETVHRGRDHARRVRVDGDVPRPQLTGESAAEVGDRRLGGGVRGVPMLGTIAANDAALMIRPDCCDFMIGITARHILKVPPTLTAKQRSQTSSVRSSTRPSTRMPALLTSTSTRPNRF